MLGEPVYGAEQCRWRANGDGRQMSGVYRQQSKKIVIWTAISGRQSWFVVEAGSAG